MTRICIAQHSCVDDLETNLETALNLIQAAGEQNADLIVFPEIHLSPFFPKHKGGDATRYAITREHPSFEAFSQAARENAITIVSNLYLSDTDGQVYDASPVFSPQGSLLGVSRMNEIAQFDGFWEQDYYAAFRGHQVYDLPWGKLGVVICFDRHFPESYRACALAGADVIATPTCCESDEPLDLFEAEMRTLSLHNCVISMLANRCGSEEDRTYAGQSLICGPQGEVLAKAGSQERLLTAEIDVQARRKVAMSRGFLSSRSAQSNIPITKS